MKIFLNDLNIRSKQVLCIPPWRKFLSSPCTYITRFCTTHTYIYIYIFFILIGLKLSSLGTAASNWPIVLAQDDDDCGTIGEI
jgi:hypothetical protein